MNDSSAFGVAHSGNWEGHSDYPTLNSLDQTQRPNVLIDLKTGQQLVRNCQVTMLFSFYACNRNINEPGKWVL